MHIDALEKPFHSLSCRVAMPGGKSSIERIPFFKAKTRGLPPDLDGIICTSDLQGVPSGLHAIIAPVFPDLDWFKAHVVLTSDTDHRCRNINLTEDWAYVDDWADKFFSEQFGIESYQQFLGNRILLCDPYADGSDIVHWLEAFPSL